jgi:hypothetical protein
VRPPAGRRPRPAPRAGQQAWSPACHWGWRSLQAPPGSPACLPRGGEREGSTARTPPLWPLWQPPARRTGGKDAWGGARLPLRRPTQKGRVWRCQAAATPSHPATPHLHHGLGCVHGLHQLLLSCLQLPVGCLHLGLAGVHAPAVRSPAGRGSSGCRRLPADAAPVPRAWRGSGPSAGASPGGTRPALGCTHADLEAGSAGAATGRAEAGGRGASQPAREARPLTLPPSAGGPSCALAACCARPQP